MLTFIHLTLMCGQTILAQDSHEASDNRNRWFAWLSQAHSLFPLHRFDSSITPWISLELSMVQCQERRSGSLNFPVAAERPRKSNFQFTQMYCVPKSLPEVSITCFHWVFLICFYSTHEVSYVLEKDRTLQLDPPAQLLMESFWHKPN